MWAFGCVLYEMLSGRKAFQGETLSDTLSMTLTAEPDWSALPSSTPAGAVHLIRRCLEKDAPRRLRGLGDIDLALDAPVSAARRRTSPWIAGAAVALIAVGAAAAFAVNALRSGPTPPAASPVHFEIPVSIQPGESGTFAISPDSKRLVFIGTAADGVMRMWERSLNSIEMRPISGTEGQVSANSSIFWSPDNQTIGFYADGAVKKISRDGGVPQVVCRVPSLAIGGTWNDRGDIVVGTPAGLLRCPADGSTPSPLTDTSGNNGTLAYVSNETGVNEIFARRISADLTTGVRTAGPAIPISPHGGQAPRWRADGQELFYLSSSGQIMAAPVSPTTIGEPRALFQAQGALSSWDVSRDGERFLLAVPARTSQPAPFSVVLNWQSTLPR